MTSIGGIAVKPKRKKSLIIVIAAVAVAAVAALLVWRFAFSSPAAPESIYQVDKLLAMEPQAMAEYVEGQGYAFLDVDDILKRRNIDSDDLFAPDWMENGIDALMLNEIVSCGNVYLPKELHDAFLENGESIFNYGEIAADSNGCVATVRFGKEYLSQEKVEEMFQKYGAAYEVKNRLSARSLALGTEPSSVSVVVSYVGGYELEGAPSYEDELKKALELSGLPEPISSLAYKAVDLKDSVNSWNWGFCNVGGREMLYTITTGPGWFTISVSPLDIVYEAVGLSSKDDVLELLETSIENSIGGNGIYEKI